jgi:hypothetical protein
MFGLLFSNIETNPATKDTARYGSIKSSSRDAN